MSTVIEISPREAYQQLSEEGAGARPTLLDVREDTEIALCRIPGAIHIPLHQLEDALDRLSKENSLLVYCHHGRRSLLAVQYLNSRGFKALSIEGGIHAWAEQIERGMPRY
jgi:adenylyltransferase/sulfurtransferase